MCCIGEVKQLNSNKFTATTESSEEEARIKSVLLYLWKCQKAILRIAVKLLIILKAANIFLNGGGKMWLSNFICKPKINGISGVMKRHFPSPY